MGEIRAITALRGVAAVLVVLYHAALDLRGRGHEGLFPPFLFGAAGVDLFFVLSGFVMVLSSVAGDRLMPPGLFCRRRIVRIVPLYWIATLAVLAHQAIANRHSALLADWPRHLACSLAFLPCASTELPLVVQGWTLEFEMAFYALFALALAFRRVAALRVLMAACALAGLTTFWGLPGPGPYRNAALLAEFALGMAVAFARPAQPRAAAAAAALLAGLLLLCGLHNAIDEPGPWRLIAWGLPAALVVGGCGSLPNRLAPGPGGPLGRGLLLLGEASYAIYLFHLLAFKLAGRPVLGLAAGGPVALWAYFAVLSGAGVAAGVAVHLAVERPLQARLRGARRAAVASRPARGLPDRGGAASPMVAGEDRV